MEKDHITYNHSSGKLYQDGMPYLPQAFVNEAEAMNYLNKIGLKSRSKEQKSS